MPSCIPSVRTSNDSHIKLRGKQTDADDNASALFVSGGIKAKVSDSIPALKRYHLAPDIIGNARASQTIDIHGRVPHPLTTTFSTSNGVVTSQAHLNTTSTLMRSIQILTRIWRFCAPKRP